MGLPHGIVVASIYYASGSALRLKQRQTLELISLMALNDQDIELHGHLE